MSKITVESYEITELNERLEVEDFEKTKQLAESLGLTGQEVFFKKDAEDKVTVFPYRKMTAEENHVYHVICPIATEVVKYKEGLIPLRVLEIASYVKETGFIDVLEVWHPANGDYKDSVLVGVKHIKRQYGTDEERYILARWGVELASFTELIKVAREKLFSSLKSKLSTAQINIENDLTKLEFFVNRYILGEGELPSCTYYGR